jgi:hypothetical protein
MPAGDAQRTWFPEMVQSLRARWHRSMSIIELIELCGQLDVMLQSIRSERGILPPLGYCRHCQGRHRAAPPRVSVRALILALARFEIAALDESRALEKSWKRYRLSQQLDLYGQPVEPVTPPVALPGACTP